jgi:hypothetical protein
VALTVLAVVVTVLARVHVGTLKADAMARGLDAAVTELGNVTSLSSLGVDDNAIMNEAAADGWVALSTPAGTLGEGGLWKVWSLSSTNRPAPPVSVYVQDKPEKAGGGTGQRADGK